MTDIAALGFSIDSKPLAEANKELAKMPAAAGDAEKAVKKLNDTSKELGTSSPAAGVTAKVANDVAAVQKVTSAAERAYKSAADAALSYSRVNAGAMASALKSVNDNMEAIAKASRRRGQYDLPDTSASVAATARAATEAAPAVEKFGHSMATAAGMAGALAGKMGGGGGGGSGGGVAGAAEEASVAVEAVGAASAMSALAIAGIVGSISIAVAAYARLVVGVAALEDAHEQEIRRLTTLTGLRSEAVAYYSDIAAFASDAGISLRDATEKAIQFARAGTALGQTARGMLDVAGTVEKLSQLAGANGGESGAAQGALAKMLADSKVSAGDLKTILSTVPQIAEQIARGLGVSVSQLRLMASEGDLTNRLVLDGLLKQSQAVDAEFAKMPKSVGGLFQSMADDLGQVIVRFAALIPLVETYRAAIELAARAAKSLNDATKPETPQQISNRTGDASFDQGPVGFGQRMSPGAAAGSAVGQRDFYAAQYDLAAQDVQKWQSAVQAATKAADDSIAAAMGVAQGLDPVGSKLRALADQEKLITDGLTALKSGLSGLPADVAATRVDQLTEALRRTRIEANNTGSALDKALQKVGTVYDQNRRMLTEGQRALEDRIQSYVDQGEDPSRAASVANAQQIQSVTALVEAKEREATAQEAMTASMGRGKGAMQEAALTAAFLAWQLKNVGASTEAAKVAMNVLVDRYQSAVERIGKAQTARGGTNAAKPLLDELASTAAAMKVVEQGAYAMRRAEAEAKAARATDGTGKLQLDVFDAKQGLTDATTLANLRAQTDLTNQLAAAAGNVALQKKIQLDYDIKIAQQQAAPGAAGSIAEAMRGKAQADNATIVADMIAQSREYVAQQEVEQQAVFLSAESASQLRFETEMLTKARQAGIDLTPAQIDSIRQSATEMAAAKAKTDQYRDAIDFAKGTVSGFFSDINQGLREGAGAWDAFGNAGMNVLNKISDKLMQMAVDDLFSAAFPGGGQGSSGGGFLNTVLGFLGLGGGLQSGPGGVGSPGLPTTPLMGTVNSAMGNVFSHGNVVPFAAGGIIRRPTLFPMANGGTGLAGEAGEEGIMPLRRGRNGRLGVDASGAGGGDVIVNVINNNTGASSVETRKSKSPGGQNQIDIIVEAVEGKMAGRMSRGQGSLAKTVEGTYGLQRVGR